MSNVIFIDNFLSEKECDLISNYILKNEDMIKQKGEDNYVGTAKNSLTGRHPYFNYLYHEPGKILVPKFRELFGEVTIQCWANTFRKGEGIRMHQHGMRKDRQFISGNIFIDGPEHIGTIYNGEWKKSKRGTFAYFSSNVPHAVAKNTSDQVRISMAVDVYKAILPGMQLQKAIDPTAYHNRYYTTSVHP